jgi:hypothetical protein
VWLGVSCAVLAGSLGASGCGGDRQDKNEPSGRYKVEVVARSFPARQHLAQQTRMAISVRNADSKTIPNVAVTIGDDKGKGTFSRRSTQSGLADPERPVWILDSGPTGGTTAYVGTWALGELRPGQEKTFRWRVTPVKPGSYTIDWEVAAGLNGKARAISSVGQTPSGTFAVRISGRPAQARVDENGNVVREGESSSSK